VADPVAANRRHHLLTLLGATPRSSATCLLVTPCCAQANTIRDRNADACYDLARRDHRISWVTLVFGQHQLGVRPTRSRHPNVIPN
jgi:hypothetical protein